MQHDRAGTVSRPGEEHVNEEVRRLTTCEWRTALALGLRDGRFEITGARKTPNGQTGAAQPQALTSDTGWLWLFSPTNVEMVTKVLNACSINEH